MWKKILLIQTCICMFLISGYISIDISDAAGLQEKQSRAVAAMSKHYTAQDILERTRHAASAIINTPATVTNFIISVSGQQRYGKPIDHAETGETTSVYAVSGGFVIKTGENDKLGKYVKIRHDGNVSVYGNCNKIYVKEGEHVRKGHVIASFKQERNNSFYYDLIKE